MVTVSIVEADTFKVMLNDRSMKVLFKIMEEADLSIEDSFILVLTAGFLVVSGLYGGGKCPDENP